MLLLVVDTAGQTGGVLLAGRDVASLDRSVVRAEIQAPEDGMQILGARELQPRAFSAQLIPAIGGLFAASGFCLTDLDAFVVVSGPGSFTGLRVGLSAVKAMAEATDKPIITLSRLAVMASMAARFQPAAPTGAVMHTVLSAGRGEFYHGIYRNAGQVCVAESLETLDGLFAHIDAQPGLTVASETSVWNALEPLQGIPRHEISPPAARDVLPLALSAWQRGDVRNPATAAPNYLHRSNAIVGEKIVGPAKPMARHGREP